MELAGGFARRGHEIHVIGRSAGGEKERIEESGVHVLGLAGLDATGRIGIDLCKDLVYALRVLPAITRSDIVVTNSFWLPVVLFPLKRLKGRIVVHVARFPKGQMWLYRFADSIQAISGAVARAIELQCKVLHGKVSVVGYPVDTELYCPPSEGRTARAAPVVLYVGRVHPEKGLHLLIDAFRRVLGRIPSARLRIVGPVSERQGGGGERYAGKLRAAAHGLPVVFVGAVADDRALSAEYRDADCFCYPSLAENGEAFGRAVLEAMAAGLPCVVSSLECFTDFLVHGRDGIVFDHRSEAAVERLSGALCTVLADSVIARTLGGNARVAAEKFSADCISTEYLTLFSNVLGRGGERGA